MSLERLQEIELDPIKISSLLGREAVEIVGRPGVYKIDVSDVVGPKVLEIEPTACRVSLVKGMNRKDFKNIADVTVENHDGRSVSLAFFSEGSGKVSRLEIRREEGQIEIFSCISEIGVVFKPHYL